MRHEPWGRERAVELSMAAGGPIADVRWPPINVHEGPPKCERVGSYRFESSLNSRVRCANTLKARSAWRCTMAAPSRLIGRGGDRSRERGAARDMVFGRCRLVEGANDSVRKPEHATVHASITPWRSAAEVIVSGMVTSSRHASPARVRSRSTSCRVAASIGLIRGRDAPPCREAGDPVPREAQRMVSSMSSAV